MTTFLLFFVTSIAEMVGRCLPPLWLQIGRSVWLLTLHPTTAGRIDAAYGGVDVTVALGWLWLVEGIRPSPSDYMGVGRSLTGMAVIMFAPPSAQ